MVGKVLKEGGVWFGWAVEDGDDECGWSREFEGDVFK